MKIRIDGPSEFKASTDAEGFLQLPEFTVRQSGSETVFLADVEVRASGPDRGIADAIAEQYWQFHSSDDSPPEALTGTRSLSRPGPSSAAGAVREGERYRITIEVRFLGNRRLRFRPEPDPSRSKTASHVCAVVPGELRPESAIIAAPGTTEGQSTANLFTGLAAVDFGTSNSTVTVYDPRTIVERPVPRELEDRMRMLFWGTPDAPGWLQQTAESAVGPAHANRWQPFRNDLGQRLQARSGKGLREAFESSDSELLHLVTSELELLVDGPLPESFKDVLFVRLDRIYQDVFRTPAIESKNLLRVQLDPNRSEYPVPSELEVLDAASTPLRISMGEEVRQRRKKALDSDDPESVRHRFHPSPKRYLGRETSIEIAGEGGGRQVLAKGLIQSSLHHLLDTSGRRLRTGPRATGDNESHALHIPRVVVTYPAVAPPSVRRQLEQMVRGLGIDEVRTDYDEATAAILFYVMRELGGDLGLGLDAFRARCRPDEAQAPSKWFQNVLLIDMGGGTTDIGFVRLTMEEDNPFSDGEDRGAGGRYHRISPEMLGSAGHLQLGGELVTLRTFQLLKLVIADHVFTQVQNGTIDDSDLNLVLSTLDRAFLDDDGRFRSGSLSAAAANEQQREAALDVAEEVLSTRWESDVNRLQAFYTLWDLAEDAKKELGKRRRRPAPPGRLAISADKVYDLLRSWSSSFEAKSDTLATELTQEEFERVVEPVVDEAIQIAAGLVQQRLRETGLHEKVDWLILSGQSCNLALVEQVARRVFVSRDLFPWNPSRVTFLPEYAKTATSVGACWAEKMRRLGFVPKAAKDELRKGFNQLEFRIDNLLFLIPATFRRVLLSNTEEAIFRAGQKLYRLDDSKRGKRRSEWLDVQPLIKVVRESFRAREPRDEWLSYSLEKHVPDAQLRSRLKVQFEIDHRLEIDLLLCQGDAHYELSGAEPVITPKEAAVEVLGRTVSVNVDADGDPPRLFQHDELLTETFHLPGDKEVKGAVAKLPHAPRTDEYAFYSWTGDKGAWQQVGTLQIPPSSGDYPCHNWVSLDENGDLRLHVGSVPYWLGTSEADLDVPGRVVRPVTEEVQPIYRDDRNPFSGKH